MFTRIDECACLGLVSSKVDADDASEYAITVELIRIVGRSGMSYSESLESEFFLVGVEELRLDECVTESSLLLASCWLVCLV